MSVEWNEGITLGMLVDIQDVIDDKCMHVYVGGSMRHALKLNHPKVGWDCCMKVSAIHAVCNVHLIDE